MKRKIISKMLGIGLVFLMMGTMLGGLPNPANAATPIYVPDNYPTIQAAANAASPGDTIIVRSGTYTENIDVNTENLTIQSQSGANSTIVQAANATDNVFEVGANYTNIIGLTIAGGNGGIWIAGHGNSRIINNTLAGNGQVGIYVSNSNDNLFQNNLIGYSHAGILLKNSNNNRIISNRISNTSIYGAISFAHLNTGNIIESNQLSGNERGIWFTEDVDGYPTQNVVRNNTIDNNVYGLYLNGVIDNTIYLNSFTNNTNNVNSMNSTNSWNSPNQMTYTYNGTVYTSYLGNYWSDYQGTDNNSDGIGDTPYSINSDNDSYPLVQPFENYVLPGDANGDGRVNALDVTKLERIIAGLEASTPGADANQDGTINALDITKAERLIVGLG